jgi:hypothetical protein
VPPALAILASDAMADGARKYGPFNWRETSVRLSVYLEAAQRHLEAYRDGQDRAEDSGYLHLSHAAACLAIIADADALGMLIDDRPAPGPAAAMLAERDGTQPAAEPDDRSALVRRAARRDADRCARRRARLLPRLRRARSLIVTNRRRNASASPS